MLRFSAYAECGAQAATCGLHLTSLPIFRSGFLREYIMQSVRRRITEILKENGSATVAELAAMLGMAQVSVRHHLDVLVGEDLVELTGVRRHDGAGRPSQMYALTPQAARLFPQRNDALVGKLLVDLKATLPPGEFGELLARMGRTTAHEAPAASSEQTLEERLDDIAQFLTERGYAARWEGCNGRYELHACNCPYAGVADHHPELCSMDLAMMRQLLPDAVRVQTQAIDGAARCTYRIQLQPTPGDS